MSQIPSTSSLSGANVSYHGGFRHVRIGQQRHAGIGTPQLAGANRKTLNLNRKVFMSTGIMLAALIVLVVGGMTPSAWAADLPTFLTLPARQAAACGLEQGIELPGTSACLRIDGAVRAEVSIGPSAPLGVFSVSNPTPLTIRQTAGPALRTEGIVSVDARAQTAFGPVRAYLSYRTR